MSVHPLAGRPVPADRLVNVPRLVSLYYTTHPDLDDPGQRAAFGTSGHRGTSLDGSFVEAHIRAISQAVAERRAARGVRGPLILGADTHALSEPALRTAVETLVANGVEVLVHEDLRPVPTPVVSHAILTRNRGLGAGDPARADGVVITPSHNPPEDGGFKYNPPHGGPAGGDDTDWIERRANEILAGGLAEAKRIPFARALREGATQVDLIGPYVDDLGAAVDLDAVRGAGLRLGADPMGGASIEAWGRIAERWGLDLDVVQDRADPAFAFMPVDHDGKVRMDCSSPYAMAGLLELKDRYDLAFGNDPDADRHGIVTPAGLMDPNAYLAVAIDHLFRSRPDWPEGAAVGKTLVSSGMIDRVAADLGRPLREVPVGFKHFVDGLLSGTYGFGGEESAGASFLRRDGTVWTTDKDGIVMGLLAAEIRAASGRDPAEHYDELAERHGRPAYRRSDAPATREQKAALKSLSPEDVEASELAGEPIVAKLVRAPGNDEPIGGLKVTTESGWFAARPSGTEDIYKIYAESFRGEEHLDRIMEEARELVGAAFARAGA